MSGAGCLTVANLPPYPCITVSMESARMTAKMVVHPGREGVDAGAEFHALGLDGSGQVASLGLDAGILGVDPGTQRVDPGVETPPEGIDPRAKIEEAAE
jgi:hypothetical protein